MKKNILLLVIICSVLVLIPSCRKKTDGSENTGIVQSLLTSESNSNIEPVVVVPAPESAQKRAEDREDAAVTVPAAVADSSSSESAPAEDVTPEETKTVETAVVTIDEPSGEEESIVLVTLPEETVKAEDSTNEETAAVPAEVETAEEKKPYYSFTYSYNGYSSDIVIADTYSSLTIPEGVSYADIAAVAVMACQAYPAEAAFITYTIDGNTVTLNYPEQTQEYLYSILPVVETEAKYLLDMFPKKEETVVAAEESAPAVEEIKTEETEPETSVVEAVAAPSVKAEEKASSFKGWSISAVAEPKFNITGGWDKPFVAGFGIRAEALFNDSWSAGLKTQYDLSAYMQTGVYAKWTFLTDGNWDFYGRAGLGMTIGVGQNKGQTSLLLEAAAGASYRITENFSVFGEFTAEWSVKKPGFELGASVGATYRF